MLGGHIALPLDVVYDKYHRLKEQITKQYRYLIDGITQLYIEHEINAVF